MFSLKHSDISKSFAWVRGKATSPTCRRVDVEAGSSALNSNNAPQHTKKALSVDSRSNGNNSYDKVSRCSTSFCSEATSSSSSLPSLGPYSNPDDYRFSTFEPGMAQSAIVPVRKRVGQRRCRSKVEPMLISKRDNAGEMTADCNLQSEDEYIELGNIPSNYQRDEKGLPLYLHAYFDTMYLFATSPYTRMALHGQGDRNWISGLIKICQLMCFCSITLLAYWESFHNAKYNVLQFMSGKGISYFVDFSFYTFCFLTKIYSVYKFTFKSDDIDQMLNSIAKYGSEYGTQSGCKLKYWKNIIPAICVCTMVFSAGETCFGESFDGWSPEDMLLEKSHKFSEDVFIWSHKDIKNISRQLMTHYGNEVNSITIAFGVTALTCNFASNFQLGTLRDLVLVATFVIYLLTIDLVKRVKDTTENVPKSNSNAWELLQARREVVWKQYTKLVGVIESANVVFDTILQLLHADNLLLYAFFASLCIDTEREDTSAAVYMFYIFNIIKAEVTYLIAIRISSQNDILRKWIRNWARHTGKILVDGEDLEAGIVLDEMESEPIGLGAGIFQIHQAFHFKFLGLVGSLVLFLADEKKKTI